MDGWSEENNETSFSEYGKEVCVHSHIEGNTNNNQEVEYEDPCDKLFVTADKVVKPLHSIMDKVRASLLAPWAELYLLHLALSN